MVFYRSYGRTAQLTHKLVQDIDGTDGKKYSDK